MHHQTQTPVFTQMEEVWEFYRADLQRVEDRIKKSLDSPVNLINQVAHYLLSSGGKRIRPLLLIITSRLNGGTADNYAQIQLASSVEFIHTATLLHDDVIDEAEIRRGKRSARSIWGNQASILVGDYLYTQAMSCAVNLANQEVNTILAEACRVMTEGETLQLAHHGNLEVTEQEYMEVIRYKTAALLSAACRLGGLVGGLDSEQQEALSRFGLNLGIAYQLVDDTLDYIADQGLLGKPLGKDLNEGKITLPLIHLLAHCTPQERGNVKKIIKTDEITERDLKDILALMKHYGSIEYSLERARESVKIAKKNLDFSPPSPHRQALFIVADYAVSRDH